LPSARPHNLEWGVGSQLWINEENIKFNYPAIFLKDSQDSLHCRILHSADKSGE